MLGRFQFIMNPTSRLAALCIGAGVLFWQSAAFAEAPEIGDAAPASIEAGGVSPLLPARATTASLEFVVERAAAALGFETAASTPEPAPPLETAAVRRPAPAAGPECETGPDAFGVTRVVELDPSAGRHYGAGRRGYESTSAFLGPKEVVLTFDDGPNPRATRDILATLREFCVQATFFVTGRAAEAHPEILAETAADGHTIAGHTWSHPMPFARRSFDEATREIERGFQRLEAALGRPPAALFRFPGLSDSSALLDYLSERGIMSLSIDVDSGDTRSNATTEKVIEWTLTRVERRGGGVVLFHDPLRRTSRALPTVLRELRRRGYRIVHLVSATEYAPPGEAPRRVARRRAEGGFVVTTANRDPARGHRVIAWPKPEFREIEPPVIAAVY